MKSRVKIQRSPTSVAAELDKINSRFKGKPVVKVGLPSQSNPYPDGTSVIMVGVTHEFGLGNVPERSFLRSTVFENRREYLKFLKKLAVKIIDGKISTEKALGLLGLKVQNDVQAKITDIDTPPLVSREGNPLILSGHLRRSITYIVETKDAD